MSHARHLARAAGGTKGSDKKNNFDENYEDEDERFPSEMASSSSSSSPAQEAGMLFITGGATASGECDPHAHAGVR